MTAVLFAGAVYAHSLAPLSPPDILPRSAGAADVTTPGEMCAFKPEDDPALLPKQMSMNGGYLKMASNYAQGEAAYGLHVLIGGTDQAGQCITERGRERSSHHSRPATSAKVSNQGQRGPGTARAAFAPALPAVATRSAVASRVCWRCMACARAGSNT